MILSFTIKPKRDPTKWHDWFAWHPVVFARYGKRHLVWLTTIRRRSNYVYIRVYEYEFRTMARDYL